MFFDKATIAGLVLKEYVWRHSWFFNACLQATFPSKHLSRQKSDGWPAQSKPRDMSASIDVAKAEYYQTLEEYPRVTMDEPPMPVLFRGHRGRCARRVPRTETQFDPSALELRTWFCASRRMPRDAEGCWGMRCQWMLMHLNHFQLRWDVVGPCQTHD